MSHSIGWHQPTIIAGEYAYSSDKLSLTGVTPANATPISETHDLNGIQGSVIRVAHIGRGVGGWGRGGQRDFNPDPNGTARPLPKSAWVEFQSMGGSTFKLKPAFDPAKIVWHDWFFIDPNFDPLAGPGQILHPLHGQPKRSAMLPNMWLELDARTGDGYVDAEGIPRIVITPGRTFLITDVSYTANGDGTFDVTVLEGNVPARNQADWTAAGKGTLGAWLWCMIEQAPAFDIGDPPIMHVDATGDSGDYVVGSATEPELNIETRACAYDRFSFWAFWEAIAATGKKGWVSDFLFTATGGQTREAKTCFATDVLNRLDWGETEEVPNSPWHIYPVHRRAQAARLGINGPEIRMCDGGASINGGVPLCTRFTHRTSPPLTSGSTAHTRTVEMLNGLEIVGRQVMVGFPYIDYFYSSPISIAGWLGHWWPTAGGADMNEAIILGIIGGMGAVADLRSDDDGALTGFWGSSLRRPRDIQDSVALSISAAARFLGGSRVYARTGVAVSTLHLDHQCDVLDGVTMEGYNSLGLFNHSSHYAKQNISSPHIYTVGTRVIPVSAEPNQGDLILPGSLLPSELCVAEETILSAEVNSVTTVMGFTAGPTTPYADQVVGHFTEWFAGNPNKAAVEHNSIKAKVQPRDVCFFPWDETLPESVRGRGFVVRTATKNLSLNRDEVTLYSDAGGTLSVPDEAENKTVTFKRRRALWLPGSTVTVKRRIAGETSFTTLSSGAYTLDPCGRENDDHDLLFHVRITSPPAQRAAYLIELSSALLPWNPQRAVHLTELRTLVENANTFLVGLGSDTVNFAFTKYVGWQVGGPDDVSYGYVDPEAPGSPWSDYAPHWGPTEFGPIAIPEMATAVSATHPYGYRWDTRGPHAPPSEEPYPNGRQNKIVNSPVLVLPSNLHLPPSATVKHAWLWIKAEAENPDAPGLTGAIVHQKATLNGPGEDETTCLSALLGGGTCAGVLGLWMLGGLGSGGVHVAHHGDAFLTTPYPVPAVSGNGPWATTCSANPGFATHLHGQSGFEPADYTEEFCNGPAGRTAYNQWVEWNGSSYIQQPLVEPNDTNATNGSLKCFNQNTGNRYFSTKWSQPKGVAAATIPADGAWHRLDVKEALIEAISIEADRKLGIIINTQQGLELTSGNTGGWDAPYIIEGGDPESLADDAPVYPAREEVHGYQITWEPFLVIEYEDEFNAPLPPIGNYPALEAPAA